MTAREVYRLRRRLDRIADRLNSPAVRGVGLNLCWLEWMERYNDTFDALPRDERERLIAEAEMGAPALATKGE